MNPSSPLRKGLHRREAFENTHSSGGRTPVPGPARASCLVCHGRYTGPCHGDPASHAPRLAGASQPRRSVPGCLTGPCLGVISTGASTPFQPTPGHHAQSATLFCIRVTRCYVPVCHAAPCLCAMPPRACVPRRPCLTNDPSSGVIELSRSSEHCSRRVYYEASRTTNRSGC